MPRPIPLIALAVASALALAPAAAAVDLAEHRVAPAPAPPRCGAAGADDVSLAVQEREMRCLVARARRAAGLRTLAATRRLDRSAEGKSADILRCHSFSHVACGREFTFWMKRSGYLPASCWRAGENLAWGVGEAGSARAIFQAWMRSPSHRHNILAGQFRQLGVGVRRGSLEGHDDIRVWTQHFGTHCGRGSR